MPLPIGTRRRHPQSGAEIEWDGKGWKAATAPAAEDFMTRAPQSPEEQESAFGGLMKTNPLSGLYNLATTNPLDTLKSLFGAHVAEGGKTLDALKRFIAAKGQDPMAATEAFGHGLATIMPFVGPAAARSGEVIGGGQPKEGGGTTEPNPWGGAGEAAGLLAPVPALHSGGAIAKIGRGAEALGTSKAANIAKYGGAAHMVYNGGIGKGATLMAAPYALEYGGKGLQGLGKSLQGLEERVPFRYQPKVTTPEVGQFVEGRPAPLSHEVPGSSYTPPAEPMPSVENSLDPRSKSWRSSVPPTEAPLPPSVRTLAGPPITEATQVPSFEQLEPTTNGSGADFGLGGSLEEQHRLTSMAGKGQKFVWLDQAGNEHPAHVDFHPQQGQTFGTRGPEGFTILEDRGGKIPPRPQEQPNYTLPAIDPESQAGYNSLERHDLGDLESLRTDPAAREQVDTEIARRQPENSANSMPNYSDWAQSIDDIVNAAQPSDMPSGSSVGRSAWDQWVKAHGPALQPLGGEW
jgi:hypothetical protein